MKILKRTFISIAVLVAICFGALNIYAMDYYRADETAQQALEATDTINIYSQDDTVVFQPQTTIAGFIFYPGGKVEYTAYAPLMKQLAENGVLCVIAQMPYNLAVLDMDAAEEIQEKFSQVENWYIGGHSLGGSMAAGYVAENSDDYIGLILLAAYSTADLTDSGLSVLSVYGSNDTVLNMEKYNKYKINLPYTMQEIVIDGGNHAQFGSYGSQQGDGAAAITAEQQLSQTVDAIVQFIKQ